MTEVKVTNLSKSFGSFKAVKNLSFQVSRQEVVCLLGPSGCGKSTLLRCIAGLEIPDGGTIEIGGEEVFNGDSGLNIPTESRNLGMVFQSYAIWPHMTVFDNVAYGLKVRRSSKNEISDRVQKALKTVKLEGFEKRFPSQLSGGQQQRVVLARCLAYSPRLLLLDEPLANLDARLRDEMRFELREIHEKTRTTMVYVTHDQGEAMAISDRIIVMNEGTIIQIGTPHQIFEEPSHPFVARFMGDNNVLEGFVSVFDSCTVAVDVPGLGSVRCRGPASRPGSASISIRSKHIVLSQKRPDGENTFKGIVSRSVYLGDSIEYSVLVGETSLRVKSLNTSIRFMPGEDVWVQLNIENLRCFLEGSDGKG